METSSSFTHVHLPVRSISFPSRIQPTYVKVEAALNHLRTWQVLPCFLNSPNGDETLQVGLIGLAELYNCVGEFVQSPQIQQALLHYQKGRLVEEVLDQSVTFLDICSTSKDIPMVMKEHLQSLQSALRRRGGDSRIERDVNSYISSRKKAKKEIGKLIGELKTLQNRVGNFIVLDMEPQLHNLVKVLHEVSNITISIFKSLLLFLSMSSRKTRARGWLKISKLITIPLLSSEKGKKVVTQVANVDFALYSIQGQVKSCDFKAGLQITQETLGELDYSIDRFETGLNYLFRSLVKHRVTFLDILTH